MIVSLLEILTEYMSILFCMQKAAGKRILIDKYVVMFAILNFLSIFMAQKYRQDCGWIMIIVYVNYFAYIKLRLTTKWADAIKVFGIMLIAIPGLQLIIYYATKAFLEEYSVNHEYGILVNCLICIIIICWKEKYIYSFASRLLKSGEFIIVLVSVLFFAYLLYLYNQIQPLNDQLMIQAVVSTIGLGVVLFLWINTENEKKRKAKELQLYEIYNKTFEEAIIAIRARQHEFDNHINAIRCMQITIQDPNDLIQRQNEYCDMILKENSFNRLLKLNTEPILIGFLYSKFMNAKEQGIIVNHEVHAIEFKNRIHTSALIEILGIFIDNAIEALLSEEKIYKIIIVKILQGDKEKISIEVANISRKYLNTEIEKFCVCGYSTKGENRGVGLSRVKEITRAHKADFHIENVIYNGDNYLSFKIFFDD